MSANPYQKIAIVDIVAGTQALLELKLSQGYVIQHIVSLTPVYSKLLIVYSIPPDPPEV